MNGKGGAPNRAFGGRGKVLGWLAASTLLTAGARAQVSLATAVDLALTHSPKLRSAQADVDKAHALLHEAHDVYVPVVLAGSGLGNSYGYSPNPPAVFTFSAQSLAFTFSQEDYIRAARSGLSASLLALENVREGVIEDTTLSFLALEHDRSREAVLGQEDEMAKRLVAIVEDRVSVGRDSAIDLTTAQLAVAQFHLSVLRQQEDTANDRAHLALALGLNPASALSTEGSMPPLPALSDRAAEPARFTGPGVASAYATARSKEEQARGDRHYLLRPQFSLVAQYNYYAQFTSSFGTLQRINGAAIGLNEGAFGIEMQVPLLDRLHQSKAQESTADAVHARAEAEDAERTALDGQLKLRHSVEVLQAQSDVARLEQQLAQQQLDALTLQLSAASASPNGPILSPKDEQNSRIAERQKDLALIDADYQLREAQIQLLRQTGQLDSWLRSSLQPTVRPQP